MQHGIDQFDRDHDQALRRIWFLGDVHARFDHIGRALLHAAQPPRWMVFLGDVDIDQKPFAQILAPMRKRFADVRVAFIHGNHDADTYEHWQMLHDCGNALPLHGRVLDLDGVRVGGLGGNFMGRIWSPPAQASFQNKRAAMHRGHYQWRDGQRPNPSLNAAIYPDDVAALSKMRADILVTHEAPSCHQHGFEAIDELARSMRVVRSFHGHHHDDRSEDYVKHRNRLGFDARAVNYCGIKNGLGEAVCAGETGW
ncbi:MAG: metallophosphoesterase family protein [Rhodoferax sp.]